MPYEHIRSMEQFDEAVSDGGEIAVVTVEIGRAGGLDNAAAVAAAVRMQHILKKLPLMTGVNFCVGGYDDDPRPICEIPEARQYVLRFVELLQALGIPSSRFLEDSLVLVYTCVAVEQGKSVIWNGEKMNGEKMLEEYRDQVRKTTH